jgi:hypothetical protein
MPIIETWHILRFLSVNIFVEFCFFFNRSLTNMLLDTNNLTSIIGIRSTYLIDFPLMSATMNENLHHNIAFQIVTRRWLIRWINWLISFIRLMWKVIMTGVWLNSFIRLMWKVLLCHCHNKATVYFNPSIMTKNNPIAG